MPRPSRVVPGLAASALLLTGCGAKPDDEEMDGGGASSSRNTLVVTEPLTRGRIEAVIERTGEIEALRSVSLFPEISGIVQTVHVDVGDRVTKDQLLVELDVEEATLQERSAGVAHAEALEAETQAQISLEEAQDSEKAANRRAEQARREHERAVELRERELITEREFEEKKLAYDDALAEERAAQFRARKANVAMNQAANTVSSAQIAWDTAKLRVRQHALCAPGDGVIATRSVEMGQVVSAGSALLDWVDTTRLVVPLKITQKDVVRIRVDQPVEIEAREAFPGRPFAGRIERVSPIVDAESGSIIARVEVLDGHDDLLRPGFFVECRVLTDVDEHSLLVPRRAVFYQEQKPSFYVVKDDIAHLVVFLPGATQGDMMQIVDARGTELAEGDLVITRGGDRLQDGDSIRTHASVPNDSPSTDSVTPDAASESQD